MLQLGKCLHSAGRPLLFGRLRVRTTMGASAAIAMAIGIAAALGGQSGNVPNSYFHNEPMRIGNEIQLVADDYMVEDRWMLKRTVGHVLKHLRNPILVQDKPWEGTLGPYPSVLYDDKLHKYRMWYQIFNLTNYFTHDGPNYYVGYAESDDGFIWTKPELDGFSFGPV